MIIPKYRNDKSDIPKNKRRQSHTTQNPMGLRLIGLLGNRDFGWLARETGIPVSTLSDYVQRGISKTDNAVRIAAALGVTVDHLVTGRMDNGAVPAPLSPDDHAEWEQIPFFEVRTVAIAGKGQPLYRHPFRRDWLGRMQCQPDAGWLTSLPSDYAAADLREGDIILCRDARIEELVAHALYIWQADRSLFVARYQPLSALEQVGDRAGERYVTQQVIGSGDGYAAPIARLLAVVLHKAG